MRMTTGAVLGALPVKLIVGLAMATVLCAAPLPAAAAPVHGCAGSHAAARTPAPPRPAPATSGRRSYLTAVRMGWA